MKISRCLKTMKSVATSRRLITLALCFTLIAAGPVTQGKAVERYWSGEGEDNLWDNPDNWGGSVPGELDRAVVNEPDERDFHKGPLIQDGMDIAIKRLTADFGDPEFEMTGGTLEITELGILWGDASGTDAVFKMSGGEVDLTGTGTLSLGWQSRVDPVRSSRGTWEMTGGEVSVQSVDAGADGNGGLGTINLFGGTFNVGTARGGLVIRDRSKVDITEGMLVLDGDKRSQVEGYIDDRKIVGYGGDAELSIVVSGGKTRVTAIDPNPSIPGDFNENGELDAEDLDLQAMAFGTNQLDFDLNEDNKVDFDDRLVWVNDLKNTWIGDSNLDGEFNSSDFVLVLTAGKYETNEEAGWLEGDWNGDLEFNSSDFVAALTAGGYEQGARPAVAAVPEPSSVTLMLFALLGLAFSRRRR